MQVGYRTLCAGSHPHRDALTTKEVVFGDGGGVLDAFFGGFVVYVVFRPDAEGVGLFGGPMIDMRAARAWVGDEVGTVRRAVGADLDGVGGEASDRL